MNKFWNWVRNEDTGQRSLYLEGVIAQESWFGDEITPAAFKSELNAGNQPITVHINSVGGDCVAASQMVKPPTEEDEAWPEFVQPTHAGTAYQVGDKITFQGERYICVLAHCVWSPADYPAGWEKQA